MKNLIKGLSKAFDNRVRLGIMSALVINESLDFNALKDLLNVTDGNLASHIKALERIEYLMVEKSFIGKKPNTRYKITKVGELAFEQHIITLEKIIQLQKK